MLQIDRYKLWFVTGSQHLYGDETLREVAVHSEAICRSLNESGMVALQILNKPVLTGSEGIQKLCLEANAHAECAGLILWMHTFSPAKMWINGLKVLAKPILHLHTQYNRNIPWATIDMDFMNLNQSAHGGREFGFLGAVMNLRRKVVAGHWEDPKVVERVAIWARVAGAWSNMQQLKVARLGDNMREVAVTEGNKVSAQVTFGFSVNGYGLGDLVEYLQGVGERAIDRLVDEYCDCYQMDARLKKGGDSHVSLREAARMELGLRMFLEEGGFSALTDTFENLHGLSHLPGLAVQRLMQDGYGFGAEGDWKTAALVHTMKFMSADLPGGNSFMEDYTYHFGPGQPQVLGAHMLEICPSIASATPSCEIHPLEIGGKADPVRLVFDGAEGEAIIVTLIDLGHRYRLLANKVRVVKAGQSMPKLPVARVLWQPAPDLSTSATAWICAGGAHHTCFSQALTSEYLEDFAEMAGIEYLLIDEHTDLFSFRQALKWNSAYYHSL